MGEAWEAFPIFETGRLGIDVVQEPHLEAATAFRYDHAANLETLWLSESLAQTGVFPATLKATYAAFGRYVIWPRHVLCVLIWHRQGKACWAPFEIYAVLKIRYVKRGSSRYARGARQGGDTYREVVLGDFERPRKPYLLDHKMISLTVNSIVKRKAIVFGVPLTT
jgi:hypothetical protein